MECFLSTCTIHIVTYSKSEKSLMKPIKSLKFVPTFSIFYWFIPKYYIVWKFQARRTCFFITCNTRKSLLWASLDPKLAAFVLFSDAKEEPKEALLLLTNTSAYCLFSWIVVLYFSSKVIQNTLVNWALFRFIKKAKTWMAFSFYDGSRGRTPYVRRGKEDRK